MTARDARIPHNLARTPLQIRTDSVDESGDKVHVSFYTAAGDIVGSVKLWFDSPTKYAISFCTPDYSPFLSSLPSDVNKTWKITKFPGPSPRITVHCNEVEVVDIIMSDETCTLSSWSEQWSKEVEQIQFNPSFDTASDYYIPAPGKLRYIHYITLVTT